MKFSLITVSYNSAFTLEDTLNSVLSQNYPNIEYLIIDGGSTDGTLEIIKKYEVRFKGKLRWISERDKGLYDAMNKGINMATGDVVGFLNSDDFFSFPNVLSSQMACFTEGVDAVYGDVKYVQRKNPLNWYDIIHRQHLSVGRCEWDICQLIQHFIVAKRYISVMGILICITESLLILNACSD